MTLMITKIIKQYYFSHRKKFSKKVCDFQKIFFENRKVFIENQYKNFQKNVEKNLDFFEIFSIFSKIFILIFNDFFDFQKIFFGNRKLFSKLEARWVTFWTKRRSNFIILQPQAKNPQNYLAYSSDHNLPILILSVAASLRREELRAPPSNCVKICSNKNLAGIEYAKHSPSNRHHSE